VQASRRKRHPGLLAAAVAIAVSGAVAGAGVAGAAGEQVDADVYARDNGGTNPCWSTTSGTTCAAGETADVQIETGEMVTWHFAGGISLPHNAADSDASPPAWRVPADGSFPSTGMGSRTFNDPGVYAFECEVHPTMTGTVTVVGDPVDPTETPTPSPTTTATVPPQPTTSPTPTAPPGDSHTTTPRPGGGADTVDPTVRSVRVTALRRAVRVRFRLSEPATVTVAVKRRGTRKPLTSSRVQARAGTRSVTLRSRKLRTGRYTVELRARDAFGNRSALTRKRLAIGR
jgi:plastocyanin